MQSRGLIAETVVYIDDHPVADGGFDARDGPLAVDANDRSGEQAVGIAVDPADIEVVGACLGTGRADQEESRTYIEEVGQRERHALGSGKLTVARRCSGQDDLIR